MGFKSFADKTAIEFGPGLTAIVGPNGSGKSNVVDAVRWVLGEGSARTLRAQRMDEVIFAGSPRRRPLPLAEVTLVLDNADGTLPVPHAEVSVTRRLDRSGAGEYLINRRPARQRDVQELFAGTGLGRAAFALVGQGEVEEVLRARPAERRAFVEEAAGITRHRLRLHEGRRRLEQAAGHLARLRDLVAERRRAVESLAREAERARREAALREALRVAELGAFAAEWQALSARRGERAEGVAALRAALSEAEAVLRDQAEALRVAREAEGAARTARAEAAEAHEAAWRALEHRRRELEMAARLAEAARGELSRLRARQAEVEARRTAVAEARERAWAEALAAGRAREAAERRAESLAARLEELARRRQAAAAAAAEAQALLAAWQAEEAAAALDAEGPRLQAALGEAEARLAEAEAAVGEAEAAWAGARAAEAAARRAAEVAGEAAAALEAHREAVRRYRGALAARREALEELAATGEGYAQGVRTVLSGRAQGVAAFQGILGTLADLLEVPRELEAAVAAALGGSAQDLVARSPEAAERAILHLKAVQGGRATFLPLGGLEPVRRGPDLEALARAPEAVGWAADLVRYPAEVEEAVRHALGRVLVARDLPGARRLARAAGYRLRVVTLDGEVVHPGGAMTGGVARGERRGGLLGREGERRRLAARLRVLDEDLRRLEDAIRRAREVASRAVADLEGARGRRAAAEAELAAARARREAALRERDRLRGAAAQAEAQQAVRRARRAAGEAEAVRARAEAAQASLAAAEREEAAAREEATAARVEAAARAAAERGARELAAQTDRELAALDGELGRLAEDARRVEAEASRQDALRVAHAAAVQALEAEEREAAGRREAAEAAWRAAEAAVRAAEAERERGEALRASQETALRHAEAELGRAEAALDALAARLDATYGLPLEALAGVPASRDPDADRRRARALRQELEALGGVRRGAEAEHREAEAAWRALAEAVADVEAAWEAARARAEALEARLGERYEETLAAVRRQFAAAYGRLTGGGEAELLAVQGDPEARAAGGLEIRVRPPGKQPAHLGLLSGGERTLVAVAFLLALVRVRPTAFCILDEVEAALDEANVAGCARYLRDLAATTQFIVVTHQRGTMELADRLVGVTMDETGVSRLLTVRLAG